MKKIITCFKTVRELEHITTTEIEEYCNYNTDLSYLREKIGTYDEAALEMALRAKDCFINQGEEAEAYAVTVGQCAERFWKDLYAVGFDKIIIIPASYEELNDPIFVTKALSEYINSVTDVNILLLGQQSSPHENSKVPFFLSEDLKVPCISNVTNLKLKNQSLFVYCRAEKNNYGVEINENVILIVKNAEHPYLRVATLREKLKVKSKCIHTYNLKNRPPLDTSVHFIKYIFHSSEKQCYFIDGNSIEEKAKVLFTNYLKGEQK